MHTFVSTYLYVYYTSYMCLVFGTPNKSKTPVQIKRRTMGRHYTSSINGLSRKQEDTMRKAIWNDEHLRCD